MKIKSGQEWDFDKIENIFLEIQKIANEKYALNYYPNQLEVISSEQMLDAYCIAPDHKVLTDSLQWIAAGQIKINDVLLGFDEFGPHRKYKRAIVTKTETDIAEVYEVKLSSGKIFKVTGNHQWLVRKKKTLDSAIIWKTTKELRGKNDPSGYSPSRIPKVMNTWTENSSKDAGWLAGMFDGEGNILKNSVEKLCVAQNPGILLNKIENILTENSIKYSITNKNNSNCKTLSILGNVGIKLEFLGTYRPERLISQINFDKLGLLKTNVYEEVETITPIGKQEIIKITTSTGTFICDGYPMHNSAVGLPLFYSHWSFGEQFVRELEAYKRGRMGLAYEIVINSNPCIAYLMEENTMLMQALVIAHASFGHNHFFKNNYLFKQWTDAEGIIDYLAFAKKYIRDCEERYGEAEVEAIIDAAHSLHQYGVNKYSRPATLSAEKEKKLRKSREDYIQSQLNVIWKTVPNTKEKICDEVEDGRFPSEPHENILYFIEKNAPRLDDWKREIIRIIRKISQYFYPQRQTKVINEGCATFFHHKIIHDLYDKGILDDGAMLEFYASHTNVIKQTDFDSKNFSGINPYALGFAMYQDIERVSMKPTEEDREWFDNQDWVGNGDWLKNVKWAIENFKDESFIQQFLSPKVIRDFRMFSVHDDEQDPKLLISGIHNKQGYKTVRESLSKQYNIGYTIPDIQVYNVNRWGDRSLTLRHYMVNKRPLESESTTDTLRYISFLWGYNVRLESVDDKEDVRAIYDIMDDETILDIFLEEEEN